MKNWLPILLSKKFLFCFLILTFLYVFFIISNKVNIKEGKIEGLFKVEKITLEGDKVTIEGKNKRKYLIEYYLKNKKEQDFYKNIELGDFLWIEGEQKIPASPTNFYGFDYRNYLKGKNIFAIVKAYSIVLRKKNKNIFYQMKNECIQRAKNNKDKAYLYAFIIGDTSFLKEEVKSSFQYNGISHLLAISGMHITVLALLFFKLFSFLSQRKRAYLCILFLFFYLFLTAFSPSTIRSYLLFSVSIFYKEKNTKILLLIACFLLWIHPFYIYHIGFLFSFILSFFLSVLQNKKNSYFVDLLRTSILSFFGSIPILLSYFYQINPLSILYNLFFIPFVTYLFFPFALLTFLFPFLHPFFHVLVIFLEKTSLFCSSFKVVLTFPKPSLVWNLVYYLFLYLFLKTYRKKYSVLLVILLVGQYIVPFVRTHSILTMIDVGQGDSLLLEMKDGSNILIDTGGKASYKKEKWRVRNQKDPAFYSVIPYLKARGIRKLDLLILTHGDFDHMGSVEAIIQNFKIAKVFLNSGKDTILEKGVIQKMSKDQIHHISEGTVRFRKNIFSFLNTKSIKNENNDSLIVYTEVEKYHIVFMGDAEEENEMRIKEVYNLGQMDILKVGHHGSKTSSSEEFIAKIKPKYSLISVGRENRYGHPHIEVMTRLHKFHSKIYRTDQDGMIRVRFKKRIEIETCL